MTLHEAIMSNSTVHRCVRDGMIPDEIVGVLAEQENELLARITELESICPKLIRGANGKLWRHDCPTELLPQPK